MKHQNLPDRDIVRHLDKVKMDVMLNKFNGFLLVINSKDGMGVSKTDSLDDNITAVNSIISIMATQPESEERDIFFDALYETFKTLYGEMFLDECLSSNLDKVVV